MKIKGIIALILTVVMTFAALCPSVGAAAKENSSNVITGAFNYSTGSYPVHQRQSGFEYRDDCFTVSSFNGCKHLELLSIQAAAASASYFAEDDVLCADLSKCAQNITEFLSKLGFTDVAVNGYYTAETEIDSIGAAVGKKTIVQDGKNYTLLAVIPRSAGYGREAAGDFEVGGGDIHEGYKAARDEVLRFVKKYIADNKIEGEMKLWIAGYGRGAAVANLLGGFFAGGGAEYFGGVTVEPENIYCYCIAAPAVIKNGADKNEELFVSGKRESKDYALDTEGEAYGYSKGGKFDANDEKYGGIRSIIGKDDVMTMLPPSSWGFTRYGKTVYSDEGLISESAVFDTLGELFPDVYEIYVKDGKKAGVKYKAADMMRLKITDAEGEENVTGFAEKLINSFASQIKTNAEYKDGYYQDAVKAVSGALGLVSAIKQSVISDAQINNTDLILTLFFTYCACASDKLMSDGAAETEDEAAAVAVAELFSYISGKSLDKNCTTDDIFALTAETLSENEDSLFADAVYGALMSAIPADSADIIYKTFKTFVKSSISDPSDKDALKAYFRACAYGADPECPVYDSYKTPLEARQALYLLALLAAPDAVDFLVDEDGQLTAKTPFSISLRYVSEAIVKALRKPGMLAVEFTTMGDAADDMLADTAQKLLESGDELCYYYYGSRHANNYVFSVEDFMDNVTAARGVLTAVLFGGGEFSAKNAAETALTIYKNTDVLSAAHNIEVYCAYALNSGRHYAEHEAQKTPADTDTEAETTNENGNAKPVNPLVIIIPAAAAVCVIAAVIITVAVKKKKKGTK